MLREGLARQGLGLRDLVLMMRKDQVTPAGMNINRVALKFVHAHAGTFNMPSRAAFAPRARPGFLVLFCFFPKSKIQRIAFFGVLLNAGRFDHLIDALPGELSVTFKLPDAIIHIPVGLVGKIFFDKLLDKSNNLRNILRRPRLDVGLRHPEILKVALIRLDVLADNLIKRLLELLGLIDDLVIHVSNIAHEPNIMAPILEIPAHHVKNVQAPGMANMALVINRHPAGIHFDGLTV